MIYHLIQCGGNRKTLIGWMEVPFQQCKDRTGKLRFDVGGGGEGGGEGRMGVSLVFEIQIHASVGL